MKRAIQRPDGNMDVSIARTAACWTPPSRGGDWLAMATTPTLLKLRRRAGRRDLDLTVAEIKEKLDAIFDTVTDGLILIDEAGRIQLFNAGAERLFGYRRDEVFGQNVKLLMPSPFQEAHDGYLGSYLATGEKKIIGVGREVVARRKDGSVFPIYLSIGELWLERASPVRRRHA